MGLLAVAGAAAAAVAVDQDRESQRVRRDAAASSGLAFEAALEDLGDLVGRGSRIVDASEEELRARGVVTIARVPLAAGSPDPAATRVERGSVPPGVNLRGVVDLSRAAFELSRDTGEPLVTTPTGAFVVIATPDYGTAAPPTTMARRSTLRAWLVTLVSSTRLLDLAAQRDLERVSLTVAGRELTRSALSGSTVERTARLLGQPWVLRLPAEGEPGLGRAAWSMLMMGLLAAAVVLALGARDARLIRERAAATDALERETRAVAELGPMLQQKLDLGEVLPAVAVRLSDEFDLDHFAVEVVGDKGGFVDAFAMGRRATPGAVELGQAADRTAIRAGTVFIVPLLRAGRVIGRLRMSSRQDLSASQLDTLRAAADLIAVATYNVELYEREQTNVARLTELDRLKDGFLGTISHELRTPITAIGGFVQLLRRQWTRLGDAERLEFLERVHRNTVSLGFLVDDLLDFARLERHALGITPTSVHISAAVSELVDQLTPLLGEHVVQVDIEPDVHAMADQRALERVLANLLTNAAKFSPASSEICVQVERRDSCVVISVADEGPGIAEDERARVFQRFYRGEGDAARSTRGAGIGLSVVHELVLQMKGTIEVLGNEPRGTRMVVRLPLPPVPVRVPEPAAERAESRSS